MPNQPSAPDTRSDKPDDAFEVLLEGAYGKDPKAPRPTGGDAPSILDFIRHRVSGARPLRLEAAAESLPLNDGGTLAVDRGADAEPRYEVLDEIGRGGIGAVFSGRDIHLGRSIAIKVLRAGHASNNPMVARFLREAQIEGQLQHPGIVPVHEKGRLADNRPFFTMKLVKGETLSALLQSRQSPRDDHRRFLTIFEKILETVAYAHSCAVIHRDLKPSNVMVGAFGEVQVMDWGLAKVLGDEGGDGDEGEDRVEDDSPGHDEVSVRTERPESRSESGSVMGTPAYMPPEQARGEVENLDARSDVFSLGAILCEILTGAPPYGGDTPKAVRDNAARARLDDALGRLKVSGADAELITITRACLSPAKDARPRHAGELTRRFSAYLASVDARARAAEIAAARAEVKAAQEHKARKLTLALATAILAAVLLGGGGYLWVESSRRDRIDRATKAVDLAMEEATRLEGEARAAPGDDIAKWAVALAAAKRANALATQREVQGDTSLRAARLDARIEAGEAQAIEGARRAERDRRFVSKLERIRLRAANLWRTRGDFERPIDVAYAAAFREYGIDVEALAPEEAGRRIRTASIASRLVAALDDWSFIRIRRKKSGASSDWQGLVATACAADPDPWRTRLREAVRKNDADALQAFVRSPKVHELSVVSLEQLAQSLASAGDTDGAIDFLRRAVRRHRDDFWLNYTLAMWCMNATPRRAREAVQHFTVASALRPRSPAARTFLGHALYHNDQAEDAIATAREALALDPQFAMAYTTLAVALEKQGKLTEATKAFESGARIAPEDVSVHLDFASFLGRHGRHDEAIGAIRRAIERDAKRADSHYRLGIALKAKRDLEGAIRAYEEAIRLKPDYAEAHNNLALIWGARGDGEKAILGFRRAIEAAPELYNAHLNLGNELGRARRRDEAIQVLRRAVQLEPSHVRTYQLLGNLHFAKRELEQALAVFRAGLGFAPTDAALLNGAAKALDSLGRPNEAIEEIDKALEANPKLWRAHYTRGIILMNRQKYESAVAAFREAIRLKPDYVGALFALGNAYLGWGKVAESIEALEKVTVVRPGYTDAWVNLGAVRKKHGDLRGSVAALRKALEQDPNHDVAHHNLGSTLSAMCAFRSAAEAYREATRRKPDVADHHLGLGKALWECGEVDEALKALRETLRLRPKYAEAHYFLGGMLMIDGDHDGALRHLKSAVRNAPKNTNCLHKLGSLLVNSGRHTEGARVLRRGLDLAAPGGEAAQRFEVWIKDVERMAQLEPNLAAILRGEQQLEAFEDHLSVAVLLEGRKRHAEAARFWKSAFELRPEIAPGSRYLAACCAAAAASGDDSADQRVLWRRQAVQWLRDELESKEKAFREGHVVAAYTVLRRLSLWKRRDAFRAIRDDEHLAALLADERKICESLWADVDALLEKAKIRTLATRK